MISGDDRSPLESGREAFLDGDFAAARAHAEAALHGASPVGALLLIGDIAEATGDSAAAEAAFDRALDAEPDAPAALVRKARCRAAAGDPQLACFLYRTGLAAPAAAGTRDPVLIRAARELATLEARLDRERVALLADRGLAEADWSPRLRHALDIAAGRRRPFVPRPTSFTWPELPIVQYHDTSGWDWVQGVEAATPAILEELRGLMGTAPDAFRPYISSDTVAPPLEGNRALLNSRDWSVLALVENGWAVADMIARCPATWAAVTAAPLPRVAGFGPTAVFSVLKAGARIAPHTGMVNTRLVCHLPLIVPPGCGFRVGNEVRAWEVGTLMVFDDTIEHEAWNDGDEDRVVLIFDIWRPELSERERAEITALFSD